MAHSKSTNVRKKPKILHRRDVIITIGVRNNPDVEVYEDDVLEMRMPGVEADAHVMYASPGSSCRDCIGLTVRSKCNTLPKCPPKLHP